MPSWDAAQYLRFNDQRTRPCRELAARISAAEPKRIIDLGCGPGNSTAVLAERWPRAELSGLDSSPDMTAAAKKSAPKLNWLQSDIAGWSRESGGKYDIVFSNAALQWVDDHAATFPRLLQRVAPGGALAFQVPANFHAPAHRIMREMASSPVWRARFPAGSIREWHVHEPAYYYDALAPVAASIDLWQTEYMHILPDAAGIVEWYKGTGLRPFLDVLASNELRAEFTAQYLERIRQEYPARRDGQVIFPFLRLFVIAYQRA